jgi:hypothetical protein
MEIASSTSWSGNAVLHLLGGNGSVSPLIGGSVSAYPGTVIGASNATWSGAWIAIETFS